MALGSRIRKKPIPDPGVKKALDPGSGSATLMVKVGNFVECSKNLSHACQKLTKTISQVDNSTR